MLIQINTMNKIPYFFLTIIIICFVACGQNDKVHCIKSIDTNQIMKSMDTLRDEMVSYNWLTPAQFTSISFLNDVAYKSNENHKINVISMVDEFPNDWVNESDIDTLITLIQSTRKARCFLDPQSSYLPISDNADIGGYAIIFINSFRHKTKTKINLGLYNCPKTDDKSVAEILKWWISYKHSQ
jgi:hypothetical protein